MPPRLKHKKSRRGCLRCKERRVKCDEVHPACGSCKAHRVECSYEPIIKRAANSSTSSASPASTAPSSVSTNSLMGGAMRRLSELRLLHHFTTAVAPTLPTSEPDKQPNMWATSVVDLALRPENGFLLHAIFAISSMHWIVINSVDGYNTECPYRPPKLKESETGVSETMGVDLFQSHGQYLDMAIQEHKAKMVCATSPDADTTFLTTVLMLIIAMRMNAVQEAHEYMDSVQWKRMARAMLSVDQSQCGPLARDAYGALALDQSQRSLCLPWKELEDTDEFRMMKAIIDFPDDDLADMTIDIRAAYREAATYTTNALLAAKHGEKGCKMARRVMAFPAQLPECLMDLFEEGVPRAFALFVHIMSCTAYVDQDRNWWLAGVARRCRARVKSILPDKWLWALPKLEEIAGASR